MDRRGLVDAAARRSTLTRAQVREALDVLLEVIGDTLAAGESVTLADFGRFSPAYYPGRDLSRFGRPGQYPVQSRIIPTFKSSSALRRRMKGES